MLLFFKIMLPINTIGQNNEKNELVNVKGTVTNKFNTGLSFATIGAYTQEVLIKGKICDSMGNFFLRLPVGKYILKTSCIRYDTGLDSISILSDTLLKIILNETATQLSEINIKGLKPVIEHKIDRTVFNVENSIFNHGVDGIDLLRQAPRVEITSTDGIKLIGKDALRIMIDGRILNLSEEEIRQKLKSLRSDNISKIEVIPIPPAKYSAEGNSGLINIILKKNTNLGWQGFLNVAYLQRVFPSFSQAGTLNYKSKSIEASLSLNNDHSIVQNEMDLVYAFASNSLHTNRFLKGFQSSGLFGGVLKYTPWSKLETGLNIDYSIINGNNKIREESIYFNKLSNSIDSVVNSFPSYHNKPRAIGISSYIDYNINNKGRKISVTYNYYQNTDKSSKNVLSEIISSNNYSKNLLYNGNNRYTINSIFLDLDLPLRFAILETGLSFSGISNKTGLMLFNKVGNDFIVDPKMTNNFEYNENTGAAYISAAKEINSKLSSKLGIRYENTSLTGYSASLNVTNKNNYGKLFPSFFIAYNPNDKNSFSLSYSKRIERPGFNDLNPFRYYSSIYSYVSGNPYLLPSVIHQYDLNYTYKNNLSIIFSYSRFINGIDYITLFSDDGTNRVVPQNLFNQNRIGGNISYTLKLYKWWSIFNNLNLFYANNTSFVQSLKIPSVSGTGGSLMHRHSFILNKKRTTILQINYNQFLPSTNGFNKTGSFGYFSSNLRFSGFNNKFQFMISTLDLFKQNKTISDRLYESYKIRSSFDPQLRNFRVSINYTFGNKKVYNSYKESKENERSRAL